jgi:hypothetical protein
MALTTYKAQGTRLKAQESNFKVAGAKKKI